MIQLLYTAIVGEAAVIMTLLFRTPLRKLVILTLDQVKRGSRGPIVVKTVGGTVLLVMFSSLYSLLTIQQRTLEVGAVPNPTDQVLMANHLLEASLMGFFLFLALMIDRLHNYIRELRLLRKTMEAAKKQDKDFEDRKRGIAKELKTLGENAATLRAKVKKLESECEAKAKEAEAAEAKVDALKKQSENFLLEYDNLLADNQNLKNQLESINQNS